METYLNKKYAKENAFAQRSSDQLKYIVNYVMEREELAKIVINFLKELTQKEDSKYCSLESMLSELDLMLKMAEVEHNSKGVDEVCKAYIEECKKIYGEDEYEDFCNIAPRETAKEYIGGHLTGDEPDYEWIKTISENMVDYPDTKYFYFYKNRECNECCPIETTQDIITMEY